MMIGLVNFPGLHQLRRLFLVGAAHLAEDRHDIRIGILLEQGQDIGEGHARHRLRSDVQDGADAESRLGDDIGKGPRLPAAAGDDPDMSRHEMLVGEFDRTAQPAEGADPRGVHADGARSQEHRALLLSVGDHLQDIVQGNPLDRHDDPLDVGIQCLEDGVLQARPGDEGHGDIEKSMVFHRILDRIVHGDPVHFLTAAARRDAGNDVRSRGAA